MKLTIQNVAKIVADRHNDIDIDRVVTSGLDDTYNFHFTSNEVEGGFVYTLHRTLKDNDRFVGTLKHPFGSYRLDCYEMDILDKQSFLYFLSNSAYDWYIQYKK